MKCLQCDSQDIVKGVRVIDRGDANWKGDLVIEAYSNPEAWIFKGALEGRVLANVCADCGFVMMSMTKGDAQRLKQHVTSS